MRLAAALSVVCLALGAEVFAQGQLEPGNAVPPEPVVLADELEPWVSSEYWAAALCRETLGQLINEHQAFASASGLANAQKLMDLLSGLIDQARTELFAKGLNFEQSLQIDSYFYLTTQPKTARFVATKDAAALAIDLRGCPAAAGALQTRLAEAG